MSVGGSTKTGKEEKIMEKEGELCLICKNGVLKRIETDEIEQLVCDNCKGVIHTRIKGLPPTD